MVELTAGIRKNRKLIHPMEVRSWRKLSRCPMEIPMVNMSRAVQTVCSRSLSCSVFFREEPVAHQDSREHDDKYIHLMPP